MTAAYKRRVMVLVAAAALAATDLVLKAAAVRGLTEPLDLGPVQLRVGFNPGVAFSLGDTLPTIVVLAVTAAITASVMLYALVTVPRLGRWGLTGFALLMGGALGNVIDRAADGVVTDYLHTGWFPTFNLADILITGGAVALLVGALRDAAEPHVAADPYR